MDRRALLLGLGAVALASRAVPAAGAPAGGQPGAAVGGLALPQLLAIVGQPGGTAWIQSFSHVLELPRGKAPRVAFAELSVIELRIREASAAEAGDAELGAGPRFRIDARGASQPLVAGSHVPMREYVDPSGAHRSPVGVSRWSAATLLSESAWMPLGGAVSAVGPRVPPCIAHAGAEWCVFHETSAGGVDAGTGSAIVQSTGWRVRPEELGAGRVAAGYNHVALLPAASRPWLPRQSAEAVQWLSNATGRKLFERAALTPAAQELLG